MKSKTISLELDIPASSEIIWKHIANWEAQGEWMLQTKVWVTSDVREGVGTTIEAFTGPFYKSYPKFAFLGLLDKMTVTSWAPPVRCDVIHTGKILKGVGSFELVPITPTQSKFKWSETINAPAALLLIATPALVFLEIGVRISLKRLRKRVLQAQPE